MIFMVFVIIFIVLILSGGFNFKQTTTFVTNFKS
ncbi:MCE family protein, partial [Francisella tularensis subsp. holarctica]|nr:MCE family protein [Francisella tularensis subsp. holarctica]